MVKLLDSVVTLSKNHIENITIKVLSVHAISVSREIPQDDSAPRRFGTKACRHQIDGWMDGWTDGRPDAVELPIKLKFFTICYGWRDGLFIAPRVVHLSAS